MSKKIDNKIDTLLLSIKEDLNSLKANLSSLDTKLDSYQERLVKLESIVGFIKMGLITSLSFVGSIILYIIYKIIDLFNK